MDGKGGLAPMCTNCTWRLLQSICSLESKIFLQRLKCDSCGEGGQTAGWVWSEALHRRKAAPSIGILFNCHHIPLAINHKLPCDTLFSVVILLNGSWIVYPELY